MNTLTLQAVLEMPQERREFLEGELFVPPAPEPLHQTAAFRFALLVQTHLLEQPVGQLFLAPLDVIQNTTRFYFCGGNAKRHRLRKMH
jgi:hypothetical protein